MVANAAVNNPVELFIHISSSEVYGTALTDPMNEEHPLNPMSPYAAAKAGADRLIYSYIKTYDLPAVIVRPFNNYGPFQHLEKAIPNFIVSALQDKSLNIHGDGKSSRDWVFVEDTCKALDKILHIERKKVIGEVINLGTGRDTCVLDIGSKVLEKLGKPINRLNYIEDRPGQVSRHISSTKKAQDLLGWKAQIELDEGLDKTLEFYKNNQQWWERFIWMKELWCS